MNDEEETWGKAVLRPRNPGERIKVAEAVLKRKDRNIKAAAERAAQLARVRQQKKDYKKGGKVQIIRPESLLQKALIRKTDRLRTRRVIKAGKKRPGAGRTLVIVRNARPGGCFETRKTLKEIGLPERNTLIFRANTSELKLKLDVVKPFVFWGKPSYKAICNVMQKKALFRDPDAEDGITALSDNSLIEKHLGDLGVLCTEDLCHVINNAPPSFGEVTSRLCPVPVGNIMKAKGLVHDDKYLFGDLGKNINDQLAMLIGE